jgi:hypothetical protein
MAQTRADHERDQAVKLTARHLGDIAAVARAALPFLSQLADSFERLAAVAERAYPAPRREYDLAELAANCPPGEEER